LTDGSSNRVIVILGGYGVFGGKLAETLLRDPRFEVVVAGRSLDKAKAFCAHHGGTAARLDGSAANFAENLRALAPFVTIDAAGPFQGQDERYEVAEAALAAGSHYLDFSDDAEFTTGLSVLDARFKASGLAALSGVSSVPALSSAAADTLRDDFSRIDSIESTILPGNRAPRGLSVIRAILAQAGKPVPLVRDGHEMAVPGWSHLERRRIGPPGEEGLPPRWTCFIGAPDLVLFPERYGARTVLFRAGLELGILHVGLWCLAWLVRLHLVHSLQPVARAIRRVAGWFEPFGSDRGGMEVRLSGLDTSGHPLVRGWSLIAGAGDGPYVPAVPAAILCRSLSEDEVPPGARACLGAFSLEDFSAAVSHLNVSTVTWQEEQPTQFQKVLGSDFDNLPAEVQALHTTFGLRRWSGQATVTRGSSAIGRIACRLIGFPSGSDGTPVTVTIESKDGKEVWRRNFGGKVFRSVLSADANAGSGRVHERFGALSFAIDLDLKDKRLHFPVSRGTLFGIPLPKWLLPLSEATERMENGVFQFDVKISLPGIGKLVRYQGWLKPESDVPY